MPSRVRLVFPDAEFLAEARGSRIRLDGEETAFEVSADPSADRFIVTGSDGQLALTAAASGDAVWIGCDGHVFEVKVQPARARGHARGREQEALASPMPATVVRIVVRPGDAVHAGDVLIALEAMKMELPIRAPRDGVVSAIHCREGELVQAGSTLVELA